MADVYVLCPLKFMRYFFEREYLQSKTTASQNMDFLAVWVITGYLSGAVTDGISNTHMRYAESHTRMST